MISLTNGQTSYNDVFTFLVRSLNILWLLVSGQVRKYILGIRVGRGDGMLHQPRGFSHVAPKFIDRFPRAN
jgi:hypothetical protein